MKPTITEGSVTDLTRGVYRRLYSGFTKGQRINKLSLPAEAWFWRVVATVDDFGNGDADPVLCMAATAGRRSVTKGQVAKWLQEMVKAELIILYEHDGEPFLHVVGFEESQPAGKNGRRVKRFPSPDESGCIQGNPDVVSASYSDTHTDPYSYSDPALAPPFSGEEFLATLADFEQHRKEIRHKLTPKAREAMYADFGRWGEAKSTLAMRQSIRNQWRGVFEPKEDTGETHNGLRRPLSAAERNNEQLERNLALAEKLRREGDGDHR